VMKLLRCLATCSKRLSGREVEAGNHGIPQKRAAAALVTLGGKQWADYVEGPRRSHLWAVTHAGRARLLLESAPVPQSAP
jgi:hypothetical protein